MAYPYGIHVAVVRVDRGSGGVTVERFFVAYDIGKAVNPMLVEGQIAGGVAQGIGGALFEEFLYDARGEPHFYGDRKRTNVTFPRATAFASNADAELKERNTHDGKTDKRGKYLICGVRARTRIRQAENLVEHHRKEDGRNHERRCPRDVEK